MPTAGSFNLNPTINPPGTHEQYRPKTRKVNSLASALSGLGLKPNYELLRSFIYDHLFSNLKF